MNKYHYKRLLGYSLWAIGLLVFLRPALLEQDGPVNLYHLLLFVALVVCLFGGSLIVDSANVALKHLAEGQPVEHADFLGTVESRSHADKHYHVDGGIPAVLDDRRPDDMPAARSLVLVVLSLLAVCVVLALVVHSRGSGEPLMGPTAQQLR